MAIFSHLIQEAKRSKGSLTVICMDLANAYGYISHTLTNKAMENFHILDKIRQMINGYLGGFNIAAIGEGYCNRMHMSQHGDEPRY